MAALPWHMSQVRFLTSAETVSGLFPSQDAKPWPAGDDFQHQASMEPTSARSRGSCDIAQLQKLSIRVTSQKIDIVPMR